MFLTIESASGGGKKIRSANIWTSVEELFKFLSRDFSKKQSKSSRRDYDFKSYLKSAYYRPSVYYISTNDENKTPKIYSAKELLEMAIALELVEQEALVEAEDEDNEVAL